MDRLSAYRGCEPWRIRRKRQPFLVRHRTFVMSVALGAAVVGLGVATMLAWQSAQPAVWNTYRTARGALEELTLADGTRVVLNTDSELQAQITGSRRNVRLLRGEALFKVVHDSRAFELRAANYAIRDLGTQFSVRLRGESGLDVLVRDGKVQVDQVTSQEVGTSEPTVAPLAQLSAGDALVLRQEGSRIQKVTRSEVDRRLAWTTGHLLFAGESVGEAIAEFDRYNFRQLIVGDARIASLQIGGKFDTTNPDSFISALERMYSLRAVVDQDSGNVTLVRRDAH
jgi:transmembrane sensor